MLTALKPQWSQPPHNCSGCSHDNLYTIGSWHIGCIIFSNDLPLDSSWERRNRFPSTTYSSAVYVYYCIISANIVIYYWASKRPTVALSKRCAQCHDLTWRRLFQCRCQPISAPILWISAWLIIWRIVSSTGAINYRPQLLESLRDSEVQKPVNARRQLIWTPW